MLVLATWVMFAGAVVGATKAIIMRGVQAVTGIQMPPM